MRDTSDIKSRVRVCRLCADKFAATHTAHSPRPVVWFEKSASILIAGQAPGARVHASGRPFTDPSGDRLRDWLGLEKAQFYDKARVAIIPMAFCFPGYSPKGADLPPPTICARTWHNEIMGALSEVRLKIIVGSYAIKWHLGEKGPLRDVVKAWEQFAPDIYPLPHPSWRNTAWLKRNPWFEQEVLPSLRQRVREVYHD